MTCGRVEELILETLQCKASKFVCHEISGADIVVVVSVLLLEAQCERTTLGAMTIIFNIQKHYF